jgi:hypothetical protein
MGGLLHTARPVLLLLLLPLQVAQAWKWALLVHVFSWYMQIHPGHAILEGRKPALLDSLVQVGRGRQSKKQHSSSSSVSRVPCVCRWQGAPHLLGCSSNSPGGFCSTGKKRRHQQHCCDLACAPYAELARGARTLSFCHVLLLLLAAAVCLPAGAHTSPAVCVV